MKILLLTTAFTLFSSSVQSQNFSTFKITGGAAPNVVNTYTKEKMEVTTTQLLRQIDSTPKGYKTDSIPFELNLKSIDASQKAKETLKQLWKYYALRVIGSNLEDILLIDGDEYQVRNIKVQRFLQEAPAECFDTTQISINFNKRGEIVDINTVMNNQQYDKILKDAKSVEDEFNRKQILYWMDCLRTAYNTKNKAFFDDILSPDALIITGKRTWRRERRDDNMLIVQNFTYSVQDKWQYIKKLESIFLKNSYLNIEFGDDAEIFRNGGNQRYYAVEVTQYWNSSSYSDEGRLFVIWDFGPKERNSKAKYPQILYRVWQHPDDAKRFGFGDFKLSKE